eukprot:scaffold4482_cov393-Prasinococcus_capsulatus_cf.AAC.10
MLVLEARRVPCTGTADESAATRSAGPITRSLALSSTASTLNSKPGVASTSAKMAAPLNEKPSIFPFPASICDHRVMPQAHFAILGCSCDYFHRTKNPASIARPSSIISTWASNPSGPASPICSGQRQRTRSGLSAEYESVRTQRT